MLAKRVEHVAKRRDGLIDNTDAMLIEANRVPVLDHVASYLADCARAGDNVDYIQTKHRHLRAILSTGQVCRLGELAPATLTTYLAQLTTDGKSARTLNMVRQIAVAWANWLIEQQRLPTNPFAAVSRSNEDRDRRRQRRALTNQEFVSLLDVAEQRGRRAWYLAAGLAGLRRGDLCRLLWADVDLEAQPVARRGRVCFGQQRQKTVQ